MKLAEAKKLKKGDLVMIPETRSKSLGGLVFEIESIDYQDCCGIRLTLKQPGVSTAFRLREYDSRVLKRFEP